MEPDQWGRLPPPPRPPPPPLPQVRTAPGWILLGAVAGFLAIVGPVLLLLVFTVDGLGWDGLLTVTFWGTPVAGVILVSQRSARARGAGLGVFIGWPLGLIVASGLCIVAADSLPPSLRFAG